MLSIKQALSVLSLGVAVITLASIAPTHAHTSLVSSTPARNAVISRWPERVTLSFNEKLMAIQGKNIHVVKILDSKGRRVERGAVNIQGVRISIRTTGSAPAGIYTVSYRVVASDGHPISAQFNFRYTPAK